jgi:hypothetical protein
VSERTKLSERVRPDCEVPRYVYDEIVALENAVAAALNAQGVPLSEDVGVALDDVWRKCGEDSATYRVLHALALNQQAGVVEALRPLEVELEKLDDATERQSPPEIVGATWRLIEAARAAIDAARGKS